MTKVQRSLETLAVGALDDQADELVALQGVRAYAWAIATYCGAAS